MKVIIEKSLHGAAIGGAVIGLGSLGVQFLYKKYQECSSQAKPPVAPAKDISFRSAAIAGVVGAIVVGVILFGARLATAGFINHQLTSQDPKATSSIWDMLSFLEALETLAKANPAQAKRALLANYS